MIIICELQNDENGLIKEEENEDKYKNEEAQFNSQIYFQDKR